MVWSTQKEKIKKLSERIVDAQRPIRILDAIKWDASIEEELRKSKFKELPKVDAAYYQAIPLGFDPTAKLDELKALGQDIKTTLGADDELGQLMVRITEQYQDVVHLLLARGTPKFHEYSRKLYGSPKDYFFGDKNTISALGQLLYGTLTRIEDSALGQALPENIPAEQVVKTLNKRFQTYFQDEQVKAKLSDGIVADDSAGSDVVKIKEGSLFSERDIDILEVD